jgi:hypothetical protein
MSEIYVLDTICIKICSSKIQLTFVIYQLEKMTLYIRRLYNKKKYRWQKLQKFKKLIFKICLSAYVILYIAL